jgi:hypothetical protein
LIITAGGATTLEAALSEPSILALVEDDNAADAEVTGREDEK